MAIIRSFLSKVISDFLRYPRWNKIFDTILASNISSCGPGESVFFSISSNSSGLEDSPCISFSRSASGLAIFGVGEILLINSADVMRQYSLPFTKDNAESENGSILPRSFDGSLRTPVARALTRPKSRVITVYILSASRIGLSESTIPLDV